MDEHYLIAPESGEEYTREEIDSKIAWALAQLEDGEGIDGEEFFEQLRRGGGTRNRQASDVPSALAYPDKHHIRKSLSNVSSIEGPVSSKG